MRTVALRGLLARKTRLLLTILAVALGVTLMAGTYVFTDTINASFDRIFEVTNQGTDVAITPDDSISGNQEAPPAMPASLLPEVRAVPGVAVAEGSIFATGAVILNKDGDRMGAGGGPNFIASYSQVPRFNTVTYAEGGPPRTAGQATLDKSSADRDGFKVGDTLYVQGSTPKRGYRLVGITRLAGVDSFGGASVAGFILPQAQRIVGEVGRFDQISVGADPGVDPDVLRARLRAALPPTVTVRTGEQQASQQSKDIRDNLGFLSTFLLAFSGVAVFIGAFVIFNTFSITVAQRTREFSLLRTLGASRAQVLRSVLTEGLLVGLAGSLVGLVLGILMASGLRALFKAIGVDLPSNGTVVAGRTILVSLLVGTLVTLASSVFPAVRATRVSPIAALSEGAVLPPGRGARWLTPIALVMTVAALVLLALGLFGSLGDSSALAAVGVGAALLFIGIALLSPRLVGPLADAVGAPIQRLFGLPGRLARENSVRQPGRTAVTSGALMIGVALVTFAAIFAASANSTIRDAVSNGSKAQAIMQDSTGFGGRFSPAVARAVGRVPGVERIAAVRYARGQVDGKGVTVSGIDPDAFAALYETQWVQGSPTTFAGLTPGQAVASKGWAQDHDVAVGDTVTVRTATGRPATLRIVGITEDKGNVLRDLTVTNADLARRFGVVQDQFDFIGFAPGADATATKARIDALVKATYPQVTVQTNAEFIDSQESQVNQLLGLIYALLFLAVIVAFFGIVNTLALSISERTRELGMLRAIGTSRRQVRRMIRWEAVIIALIGGILGSVLGILLAALVSRTIDGFIFTVPFSILLTVLIIAGILGVIAAVLPARRASKLDVLEALAYE